MAAARARVNVTPHSTAPLAPRVSVPTIPSKLPFDTFDVMSLELQEAAIIEDILYVLMVPYPMTTDDRDLKDNTFATTSPTITPVKLTVLEEQNSKSPLASTQVSVI
jgi:hypothetical protein